jgi:TonB family protein
MTIQPIVKSSRSGRGGGARTYKMGVPTAAASAASFGFFCNTQSFRAQRGISNKHIWSRYLFFISALTITLPLLSQNKCDSIHMFPTPEELPIFDKSFPNDINKLYEFIWTVLRYPATARADNIIGDVLVQFWVDTTGFTIEHRIIQSVRQDLDDEVLRIAKLIKFDIPAKNSGNLIGTCLTLPVRFQIFGNGNPPKNIIKQYKQIKSLRKLNRK